MQRSTSRISGESRRTASTRARHSRGFTARASARPDAREDLRGDRLELLPLVTRVADRAQEEVRAAGIAERRAARGVRSEEHTSELQSQSNLVCRLLLENKKYSLLFTRSEIAKMQPPPSVSFSMIRLDLSNELRLVIRSICTSYRIPLTRCPQAAVLNNP